MTDTTVGHTALPWKASTSGVITGADGGHVASFSRWPAGDGFNNAEFTVTAVNLHEELVEALRALQAAIRRSTEYDTVPHEEGLNAALATSEALLTRIARAEEGDTQ